MSFSALLILSAAALVPLACRDQKHGLRVGSDAATLKVRMANLDAQDQNRPGWIYELSGCVSALNGQLGDDGIASFSAVGLKPGLENCQFRIKVLAPIAGITFAQDAEPNVLYWTRALTLSQDSSGQLVAVAGLQKLYQAETSYDAGKSFALNIPIRFPSADAVKPVTANIDCNPPILKNGLYTATNDKEGTLSFAAIGISQDTAFECTQVLVSANGVLYKYKGAFSGDSGKFHGVPDQTFTLASPVDLALQTAPTDTPPPATDTSVVVSTKPGGECPTGQVYDTAKHACAAKAP